MIILPVVQASMGHPLVLVGPMVHRLGGGGGLRVLGGFNWRHFSVSHGTVDVGGGCDGGVIEVK